jgi:TRAP-type C4-dicarboxylate transport system permease small subunit
MLLRRANAAIRTIEAVFMTVAVIVMNTIMLIGTIDVVLRYVFNAPLRWTFDAVSLYLMVALFFLSLSDTLQHNRHVSVDILHRFAPAVVQRSMEIIGYCASVPLFWILFERGAAYFLDSALTGAATVGDIFWPTWLSAIFIPLGLFLLLLRIAFRIVALVLAVVSRAPAVEGTIPNDGGAH